MTDPPLTAASGIAFVVRAGLALGLGFGGCARPTVAPVVRPVSLAAFAQPPEATFEADLAERDTESAWDEDEQQGADGAPLVATGPGFQAGPALLPSQRLRPGERVLVDSLVGQVNGQPIFADEFFEPIEDQLVALSKQTRGEQFVIEAGALVSEELRQVVLNALFLAEAEAMLTVEEKQGIRAWLAHLEKNVIAGYGGSREQTDRALRESEDQSIEDHLEGMKDRALIQKLVQEKIAPRVIVSWRDIEREYQRREAEFNPSPEITLARIRVPTASQPEIIEEVTLRLAAGEGFLEVAESVGRGNGVWETFEVADGDLSNVEFANETLTDALAGLRDTGDMTEAFEIGTTTWWVYVVEFDLPERRDLYDPDVQRILASAIRRARGGEEQDRFIASLLERGIFDELEEMGQRLLRIAVRRYAR